MRALSTYLAGASLPIFRLRPCHAHGEALILVASSSPSQDTVLGGEAPMTRLLCTMLLCALGTAPASAQTAVSQQLLELEDDERNAAFTLMLQDGHRKCDQVVRTLFRGTVLGVDEWEAMCRDRRSYSFTGTG